MTMDLYKLLSISIYCASDDIESAKQILSDNKITIDAITDIDKYKAFDLSCKNGHLEIVKWLVSIGMDIYANNNEAFRLSCYKGHHHIAKWIYSVGSVNVHADINNAFIASCFGGHNDIAKWLISLDSVDIQFILKKILLSEDVVIMIN